jgi:hypothetical protein
LQQASEIRYAECYQHLPNAYLAGLHLQRWISLREQPFDQLYNLKQVFMFNQVGLKRASILNPDYLYLPGLRSLVVMVSNGQTSGEEKVG